MRRWVPGRLVVRGALLPLVGLLLLVVLPPATAHALLVSSDPGAGSNLPATPAVVTLSFDEPLVGSLSRATVTTPDGHRFTSEVSGEQMTVRLDDRAHGVYRVTWKTVSKVDGHVITGSFEFGVAARASAAAVTSGPTAGDVAVSVLRGVEYALLLLACGMCLLELTARGSPLRQPFLPVAAGLFAAGVVVVTGEIWLAGSGLSWRGAADYLSNDRSGWARAARLALEAGLLGTALLPGPARRRTGTVRRTRLALLPPVLLTGIVVAVALAGHGADVEPAWQGITVNAAHLAAAGAWAGGIMALAVLRLTGQWQAHGREALRGFSRIAPWAFLASVVLGGIQAAQLLGSPEPVLGSSYGLTLVAKAVAIAAMVPLSLLAWRRLRVHVRAEAVMALVVVAAAAALAAFPVIPKEAREAAAEQPPLLPAGASAVPHRGDVTMGGRAGKVMVGISVHPGHPGRNTVTAYLASPARRTTSAHLRVGDQTTTMSSCGARCRTATVELAGHDVVRVEVSGQGVASYHLPALPAPPATALVRRANRLMGQLRSYREQQVLSGIRSRYRYQVPHRLFVRTWFGNGAQDTFWVGRRLYRRSSPSAPWRLSSRGDLAPVPYFPWEPFEPLVDAHVIGRSTVGGVPVRVVSVFDGHGRDPDPVWFTLYVDSRDRVLRSQMWATNHFMNDRYTGFNQAVRLPKLPRR